MKDFLISEHERRRDFLLKFNGMHECCHMTWDDCAAVYEAETGNKITGDVLRKKVKRAVDNCAFVHVTEFPKKVVVSAFELTVGGCIICAVRKFFTRLFGKK